MARRTGDNRSGSPNGIASEHLSGPRASRIPSIIGGRVGQPLSSAGDGTVVTEATISDPVEFDDVVAPARLWIYVGPGSCDGTGAGRPTLAETADAEEATEDSVERQGQHYGEDTG